MTEEIKQEVQVEEVQKTDNVEEKKPKKERTALLYIQTTKNNTINQNYNQHFFILILFLC